MSYSDLIGVSSSFWIPRSRDCVIITLECKFVILNEVKNLIRSMRCTTEILRLWPQNDIATQAPSRGMTTVRYFIAGVIEHVAQIGFCHPELVSGSRNVLTLLDAETSSA